MDCRTQNCKIWVYLTRSGQDYNSTKNNTDLYTVRCTVYGSLLGSFKYSIKTLNLLCQGMQALRSSFSKYFGNKRNDC